MRRLYFALLALCVAGAAARAQEVPVTGPCATPDSVAFRGNKRISDALLRGDAGITPGAQLNFRTLQRAIKQLYATNQFDEISVVCEPATIPAGKTTLVFNVTERPILGDVQVKGPERVSLNSVKDRVDLLIGRPVDPAQVTRSVARIDSLYESEGYYLARVRVDTTIQDGQANLTFVVDEGKRLAISGVRIDGNQALSDKAVVKSMSIKPEGFLWWKQGEFDEDKFASDLTEHIPDLYANHGFIDMQVVRDTMTVNRDKGKGFIDLRVKEGPQYRIGDFEVNGAQRFSADEIARYYPFGPQPRTLKGTVEDVLHIGGNGEPGNVFDKAKWDDATNKVEEAYANEGYIYAQVRPVIERHFTGKDSVPTVNLRWEINEGRPAIVNRVDIVGNDITSENCIRNQILMVPGDVFNRDLLIRSYQMISNLGFFDTPLPPPDTHQANDQGDVDVTFKVKEKRTGNVNFGASVGQGTGVGGFIGFDQPNLFGQCKRGSLQWQFGRYINDFNVSYTDPRILESRISGTVNLYDSDSRYIIADLGRTKRVGGQLQFGFPVPWSRWSTVFLSYGAEAVRYGGDSTTLLGSVPCSAGQTSNCFRSTVGVTFDRDTRGDMPFPTSGVHQSITAQFNGGPLGGAAAFQRYTAEMRSYATLASFGGDAMGASPIKLVFGLSERAGWLFGNPGPFFFSQQFSLGGVQFGEPLRGYEEFSITPHGYISTNTYNATRSSFGSAFFTNTAELGVRFNQMIYTDAFYDAGNLWAEARDFDPTRLFRGAGFGAALVTPLGPLGIDLGYGFDRVDQFGHKSPKWIVHFKFGQFFQ